MSNGQPKRANPAKAGDAKSWIYRKVRTTSRHHTFLMLTSRTCQDCQTTEKVKSVKAGGAKFRI